MPESQEEEMNVDQFKSLMWRELGRLPKPNGQHVKIGIEYSSDRMDDYLLVYVDWWTHQRTGMIPMEKMRVARIMRLKDIPEGTPIESLVHTACDQMRRDIELKNVHCDTILQLP